MKNFKDLLLFIIAVLLLLSFFLIPCEAQEGSYDFEEIEFFDSDGVDWWISTDKMEAESIISISSKFIRIKTQEEIVLRIQHFEDLGEGKYHYQLYPNERDIVEVLFSVPHFSYQIF